ncbi:hypothetical protein [Anaeromassilibacillus senegalensis]|uniref:hypothetical protein n=1 Tax=Anaeromassilibacillus senegalensis TaxID=1673717 RepID=UPI000680A05F|nr:hypothetical protein [Anaeromassilibacillus senegalensis]
MGHVLCYSGIIKDRGTYEISYICLDIEWNISTSPNEIMEALSIAAVYVQDESVPIKTFFKYIQPAHKELVTPATLKLLSIGLVPLMQAESCAEVMGKLDCSFHAYDTLVIWNREALAFLQQTMKQCGTQIHTKNIVVLQDLLGATCKDIRKGSAMGFCRALQYFSICHNPELLHISKYDALYLQQLYCAIADRLRGCADVPLYHTTHSRLLHHADCRHLNGRTAIAASWEDAILGAPPLCKSCARSGALRTFRCPKQPKKSVPATEPHAKKSSAKPSKKSSQIKWSVAQFADPFEEAEVEAYCQKYGIGCTVACRWIFLRTPAAHWRLEHNGHKVLTVYHENLRSSSRSVKRLKMQTGFHQQKVYSKNVFRVIDYIEQHDRKSLNAYRPDPCTQRA